MSMGDDKNGEYEETKIRVYKKVKSKDEGAFQKYVSKPISKLVSGNKSSKEKRLTA